MEWKVSQCYFYFESTATLIDSFEANKKVDKILLWVQYLMHIDWWDDDGCSQQESCQGEEDGGPSLTAATAAEQTAIAGTTPAPATHYGFLTGSSTLQVWPIIPTLFCYFLQLDKQALKLTKPAQGGVIAQGGKNLKPKAEQYASFK